MSRYVWRPKRIRNASDLSHAINANSVEEVKLCIADGVDMKHHGGYMLYYAIKWNRSFEIIRCLLEHGARLDYICDKKECAMTWAAFYGMLDIVRLLVEHGADIHYINTMNRMNVMDNAIAGHNQAVIDYLRDKGAVPVRYHDILYPSPTPGIHGNTSHTACIIDTRDSGCLGDCSICHESMTAEQSTQLSCQHVFHAICLLKWVINRRTCPMCRAQIK